MLAFYYVYNFGAINWRCGLKAKHTQYLYSISRTYFVQNAAFSTSTASFDGLQKSPYRWLPHADLVKVIRLDVVKVRQPVINQNSSG